MIAVTFLHGRDELATLTLPEVPAVGDEVAVPGNAVGVWVVAGRRWHLPERDRGEPLRVLVWLLPA